jgi:hypothetical protein
VKFAKMILAGSMLFVPALTLGVAQQAPANPASPAQPEQQYLQQDKMKQDQAAQPGMNENVIGVIAEVRDDSFSVRKDADQSLVWFAITPELKSSASSELVTGNRVRVAWKDGDSPDRMVASSVTAEPDLSARIDTDTDLDLNLKADDDTYDTDEDADELPRTASPLPLVATLGLMAMLGAAAVAFVRKF